QGFRIKEIPIPTYYGDEISYVNGMKYARDVMRAVYRYRMTVRSTRRYPEFGEYFVHYPLKRSKYSSHYYFQKYVEHDEDILDLGCGEVFFAELIVDKGNRIVGVDLLEQPQKIGAFKAYWQADLSRGLADVLDKLHGQTFNKVLLPDVIEHL